MSQFGTLRVHHRSARLFGASWSVLSLLDYSTPAFSTLAISSRYLHPAFSTPAFSAPPMSQTSLSRQLNALWYTLTIACWTSAPNELNILFLLISVVCPYMASSYFLSDVVVLVEAGVLGAFFIGIKFSGSDCTWDRCPGLLFRGQMSGIFSLPGSQQFPLQPCWLHAAWSHGGTCLSEASKGATHGWVGAATEWNRVGNSTENYDEFVIDHVTGRS